jgi:CRP-like cAMP-binding protein
MIITSQDAHSAEGGRTGGEVLAALSSNRWLKGWPETAMEAIASKASMKRYSDDVHVHPAREPMPGAWLVVDGALERRLDTYEGVRSVLSRTQAGGILGLNCVFADVIPTYNVVACGFTRLIHVPRQAILDVFSTNPQLLWFLARYFFDDLQTRTDHIALQATAPLRQRIIMELLQLARQASEGEEQSASLKVSQETLAFLLATSRQSVNRELQELRSHGLIGYRSGKISIPNISRLANAHATYRMQM